MKVLRVTNPDAAITLTPWFVPVMQTREEICAILFNMMTDDPERTYVTIVIDGQTIKGMAVTICRFNDAFIWQARSNGLDRKTVDYMLGLIEQWARSKGFKRLSAYPNRNRRIWQRRWGFMLSQTNKNEVYKEI